MKKNVLTALLLAVLMLFSLGCSCKKDAAPDDRQTDAAEYALRDPLLTAAGPAPDNARVFYEIFTGSFSDSDGDGIGDLRGVINRFDYLNDGDPDSGKSLGIEGIWLTPIFSSPSYHKYDVTDYCTVDPQFGTQADLDELIALCHARGVKLILDLPLNHTSRECAWFLRFAEARRNGDPSDPYYDFYSCCTEGEPLPEGRRFTKLDGTDVFYESNFSDDMPELNFDNPAVREELLKVARFYLDRGVDGFRFDAAKYCYFGEHDANLAFWTDYLSTLRAEYPGLYTVAEVWDDESVVKAYYPATNCFDFTAAQNNGLFAEAVKSGEAGPLFDYVERTLDSIRGTNPDAMFVPFLSNHDMDRAAGFLPVDAGQMQMAANLYLLGPGSPFIYYGEELGMRGSRGGEATDANRRLAMVWGDGDTVKDPVGATYPAASQIEQGVSAQRTDPDSLYTYYKKLIMIRKANPAIARGEYRAVAVPGSPVGGFTSTGPDGTVLVLHNLSASEQTIDVSQFGDFTVLRAFIGRADATLSGTTLTLGPGTSAVLG